ncbi:Hypothetical predicted protein [Paramuricea clavata]|uniref:Uncharacterized protein n=1 Tax=Paramuricea clavata TaxID=317549 RepID=A0A6S7FDJ9_PARCT|nr:Hypothetical predicted protein [Paramuricea clavata]
MPLTTLLDAENKEMFMRVLNISYPLTIENVQKESCSIRIKLNFPSTSDSDISVKYKANMMYIPAGYYSLEKLIHVINSYVDEYDVNFRILNGSRIGVTYNIEREYWFSNESITVNTRNPKQIFQVFSQTTKEGDELEIELTKPLQYILANEQGTNGFVCSYMGTFLPDISDGIDKMFIYCDQVENSIVGDTYGRLLAIVPLKPKDRGNGSLCVYTPPDIRHKLTGAEIKDPFHIAFPEIDNFTVCINEAEIPPVYHNSQEAYMSLRQILDLRYSEMPFSYDDYVTDYGIIVNDLSPNRDGHSQVLPNATSEKYFESDIVEQHPHTPIEIDDVQQQQYEGYDDDNNNNNDNGCDEIVGGENNELDEEAINSFILQLFQLKKNLMKKRENRIIPSVNKYLKLDFEEKGEQLTPTVTRNLLHICELILADKIHIDVSPGDREVMEYIVDKDCPTKDKRFTLVEDFCIHRYICKAVKKLDEIQCLEQQKQNGQKRQTVSSNRR